MRLFRKFRLSHQLLLILLLIPSILVVSLLYYTARQHVGIKNKPKEQIALSASVSLIEKIDRNLSDRFSDVRAFSYNPAAVAVLENKLPDTVITSFMNTMNVYYGQYELMMLCSLDGKVVAVSTKDKNNNPSLSSRFKGKNINDREWFRSSIVTGGPAKGAWHSDFNIDEDIAELYQTSGYGMDFSSPVRNQSGAIIGVWRCRADWEEITGQVRNEAETVLTAGEPGSMILIMDKQGYLIDAKASENILKVHIGKNNLFKNFDFTYNGIPIDDRNYLYGWAESKGVAGYQGNQWKVLTLVPKVNPYNLSTYQNSDWTSLLLYSLILLFLAILISLIFVKRISKRLTIIKNSLLKLSQGEPVSIADTWQEDEIGEMSTAAGILSKNFNSISDFAQAIGNGNLDTKFTPLSEKDILGKSLITMQVNLKQIRQEQHNQQWMSVALTKFGELLRAQESTETKYRNIISFIAHSVQARQGVLFVTDHSSHEFPVIEIKATFAINAERLNTTTLHWGEGSAGQCIKDQEIIMLDNVPEDYTQIESGLGMSVPKFIILIPVLFNSFSEGAIELASFSPFPDHHIAFLEKAASYTGSFLAETKMAFEKRMSDVR